jgi:hypothetical protein
VAYRNLVWSWNVVVEICLAENFCGGSTGTVREARGSRHQRTGDDTTDSEDVCAAVYCRLVD